MRTDMSLLSSQRLCPFLGENYHYKNVGVKLEKLVERYLKTAVTFCMSNSNKNTVNDLLYFPKE